jgi:hypothetical protein
MKIRRLILILLFSTFLSSCDHKGSFAVESPPDIIIHVNKAGVASITTPGSAKCKVQNQGKPGCLHFDKGNTGLITFKRTGPPAWAFTEIEICKVVENGDKVCSLNVWERLEFAATDNAGTMVLPADGSGRIDLVPLSASLDTFLLLNQNSFNQEYYYRVQLCNGDNCTWADPPIENEG